MYGLVVSFKPTRVAVVTGGHNEGHNFGNVATESGGTGDVGGRGDGARSNRACCNCGVDQLKRNLTNLGKGKTKKDEDGEWFI